MSAKSAILYNLNKSANEGKVPTLNERNENIYVILKEFGARRITRYVMAAMPDRGTPVLCSRALPDYARCLTVRAELVNRSA